MERYTPVGFSEMDENKNGDYVLYEDIKHLLPSNTDSKPEEKECTYQMRKRCKLWDLCCEKMGKGEFPECAKI